MAAFHSGRDLMELSRGDIESFIGYLLSRLSASTAAVRFRSLQQLYKWAVGEGLVQVSPMAGMKVPTVPPKPVPIISDDHVGLLLKACEGTGFAERRDTAIIRLFLEAGGLRLSEMLDYRSPMLISTMTQWSSWERASVLGRCRSATRPVRPSAGTSGCGRLTP